MAGTSMATPAVAGAVALVRQYLMEGFHVSGEKNLAVGFTPMGALLKAIIVNSGKDMSGSYSENGRGSDMENTVLPTQEYGFGLVQLDRTLVLKGHNDIGRALFLHGDMADMPTVETGDVVEYEFDLAGALEDVKVTLVWHDPESMEASRVALVNDLDLEVYDSEGVQYFPNNRRTRDNINNVEQAVLGRVGGKITVKVRGFSVPMGPQPFALVVSRKVVGVATTAPTVTATAKPTTTIVRPATTKAPSVAPEEEDEEEPIVLSGLVGAAIGVAVAGVVFVLYKCVASKPEAKN
jgi:hypothetical protein